MPACQNCFDRHIKCSLGRKPQQIRCTDCSRRGIECVRVDTAAHTVARRRRKMPKMSRKQARGVTAPVAFKDRGSHPTYGDSNATFGEISRILLAIDAGTGHCKIATKVIYRYQNAKARIGNDRGVLMSVEALSWSNNRQSIPTVLAYAVDATDVYGEAAYEQLWGYEAEEAVRFKRVKSTSLMRWLKAAMFGAEEELDVRDSLQNKEPLTNRGHDEQEQQRKLAGIIGSLPANIRQSGYNEKDDTRTGPLTCMDLYSDFLRHAWRFALKQIKVRHPSLPWPDKDLQDLTRPFDPTQYTQVETAIPLPADSRPHHVTAVIKAAQLAGIPSPMPISEPIAAYAYDLQQRFEVSRGEIHLSRTLIGDLGAGSNDAALLVVDHASPITVREEIAGEDQWSGGKTANSTCWNLVQKRLAPFMERVLEDLTEGHGRQQNDRYTERELQNEVEVAFEQVKMNFNAFDSAMRNDKVLLEVPYMPQILAARTERGFIVLSKDDMKRCFEPSLSSIKRLFNGIIERYHAKHPEALLQAANRIHEILLVGGQSSNPYLFESIRHAFELEESSRAGYSIPVRQAGRDTPGSDTCIARGSILMMLDQSFLRERVVRRGYCVKFDKECNGGVNPDPNSRRQRDPHDNTLRHMDMAHWLIRPGDRIAPNHRVCTPKGCWRGLWKLQGEKNGYWVLDEHLFFSDFFCAEDVNVVKDPRIQQCGQGLSFRVTAQDAEEFPEARSKTGKGMYKWTEYRVEVTIRNNDMTYRVIIPRSGRFPEHGPGNGPHPIIQTVQLNVAGAYELINRV